MVTELGSPPVQRQEISGALSVSNQKGRPHRHVGRLWELLASASENLSCTCFQVIHAEVFGTESSIWCISKSNVQLSNSPTMYVSIDLSTSIHPVQGRIKPLFFPGVPLGNLAVLWTPSAPATNYHKTSAQGWVSLSRWDDWIRGVKVTRSRTYRSKLGTQTILDTSLVLNGS